MHGKDHLGSRYSSPFSSEMSTIVILEWRWYLEYHFTIAPTRDQKVFERSYEKLGSRERVSPRGDDSLYIRVISVADPGFSKEGTSMTSQVNINDFPYTTG